MSGGPAAGKTTLARALAAPFGLTLIEKDAIKEPLFDALGVRDVAWSQALSRASFHAMFRIAASNERVLLEGNFGREHRDALRDLGYPVEVHCRCDDAELIRRFEARAAARHRGHRHLQREELLEYARRGPLHLGGPLLELDTAAADAVDTAREWLAQNATL